MYRKIRTLEEKVQGRGGNGTKRWMGEEKGVNRKRERGGQEKRKGWGGRTLDMPYLGNIQESSSSTPAWVYSQNFIC